MTGFHVIAREPGDYSDGKVKTFHYDGDQNLLAIDPKVANYVKTAFFGLLGFMAYTTAPMFFVVTALTGYCLKDSAEAINAPMRELWNGTHCDDEQCMTRQVIIGASILAGTLLLPFTHFIAAGVLGQFLGSTAKQYRDQPDQVNVLLQESQAETTE